MFYYGLLHQKRMTLTMKTEIKISEATLNLQGLTDQLNEDMSGLFNGHVAGMARDGQLDFAFAGDAEPDLNEVLAGGELFLPFTSPDAEGGMLYADGSSVVFDHDPEEFWFGESDCFGYLVSLDKGQYCVTPGLCVLNTLGPCCIHHYEVEPQTPNSRELQERMLVYLKRFMKNDTELKEMKEAI